MVYNPFSKEDEDWSYEGRYKKAKEYYEELKRDIPWSEFTRSAYLNMKHYERLIKEKKK